MTMPSNKQLREFIMRFFSDSELDTFCFDYFLEVRNNFSGGMRKNDKVMDLIEYCRNRKMMSNLLINLQIERPDSYQKQFAPQEKLPDPSPLPKTESRNPKQIFICHATADAELAHRLADDLIMAGYAIWIAPDSIRPGEKWLDAISRGLDESGLFVVLVTPQAVKSGWVKKEMNIAINLENRGEMQIFPLDVLSCKTPNFWSLYQFVPFQNKYEQGLSLLRQAVAGMAVEQPKPTPRKPITTAEANVPKPKPNSFIHEKTGMEFVRVPAGEFLYGEQKERKQLEEYWISRTPVTHAVYKRFIDANPSYDVPHRKESWAKAYNWNKKKRTFPADKAAHPVVLVSWHDAIAFCKWAGLSLPTEEEWEKAARGTDGRKYPWGDSEPTDKLCNFNKNVDETTSVGYYSPQGYSPYSCVDMSGNVWEWCLNKYDSPADTRIDATKDWRVLRGGSFGGNLSFARTAYRDNFHPSNRYHDIGFRMAVIRRSPSQ